ncbi:MAG TPA: Hsp33 family molecular chaperone HslO [Steroidobacteraceae bacterium]|nr:Hsp33 family molecular chaperone HslO [Steroidobacteraceae bacterium]HQR48931.1 Hsp33 family molecular chaperone HslO [Steroidobacteraceae bacterium]
MAEKDSLRRFVFERYPFRGQLVHLGPAWRAMMEHHDYPDAVRDSLGEAVAAAALLASTLKFKGQLSLQLRGTGPMHLMLVECSDGLAMRAVARFRLPPATRDLRELSGNGTLTVTLEGEDLVNRYQGVVPLAGERMADCLREYFETSEQLPTRLWLHADGERSSGLLLQRLPVSSRPASATESGKGGVAEDEIDDAWQRVQLVAGTVTGPELAGLADRELLRRLFAEDDVRMFESAPVFFRCRCSRERVAAMLRSLGREEIDSILEERGDVEVRCEFCSRSYRFDAVDAGTIFSAVPDAPRGGVH